MPTPGLRVGVVFGGRSVEHDVSIITGLQAVEVLSERHSPAPVYISRSGAWYAGEALRDIGSYRGEGDPSAEEVSLDLHRGALLRGGVEGSLLRRGRRPEPIELDVIVLATHGTEGEDGCLEGALELADIPYVGPPVGAAAAAMDKVASKAVLRAAGLPVAEHLAIRRESFERDGDRAEESILARFELPVYVKPASLGSSVGVSRCATGAEVGEALELCFELDRVALVEPAIEGGIEVNCAVIGRPGVDPRASVCEQPIAGEQFLSFQDKYMGGEGKAGEKGGPAGGLEAGRSGNAKGPGMHGARRLIPAPIGQEQTRRIQELACETFTAFGCAGVSRVDFLIDASGEPLVNECNTIPGSFSFYLWEPAGLPFVELMDELIDIALAEHAEKRRTTRTFETNLLAERAAGSKA
jgi:D-alanine-D-alanine ligase